VVAVDQLEDITKPSHVGDELSEEEAWIDEQCRNAERMHGERHRGSV
jgi:hypothetical protein